MNQQPNKRGIRKGFAEISTNLLFNSKIFLTGKGVLIIFVLLGVSKLVKYKILTIILASFLAICAMTVTGYELTQHYYESLPTVNDQGVDLKEYKPFIPGTKAVRMDRPASLSIKADLPRIDGATALYPLYAAFAQAVYTEGQYDIQQSEVMCNNTIGSYENLINGKVDIIFTARPSKKQLELAQEKGIDFNLTLVTPFSFLPPK